MGGRVVCGDVRAITAEIGDHTVVVAPCPANEQRVRVVAGMPRIRSLEFRAVVRTRPLYWTLAYRACRNTESAFAVGYWLWAKAPSFASLWFPEEAQEVLATGRSEWEVFAGRGHVIATANNPTRDPAVFASVLDMVANVAGRHRVLSDRWRALARAVASDTHIRDFESPSNAPRLWFSAGDRPAVVEVFQAPGSPAWRLATRVSVQLASRPARTWAVTRDVVRPWAWRGRHGLGVVVGLGLSGALGRLEARVVRVMPDAVEVWFKGFETNPGAIQAAARFARDVDRSQSQGTAYR